MDMFYCFSLTVAKAVLQLHCTVITWKSLSNTNESTRNHNYAIHHGVELMVTSFIYIYNLDFVLDKVHIYTFYTPALMLTLFKKYSLKAFFICLELVPHFQWVGPESGHDVPHNIKSPRC